jgi:hypothetical protein
VEHVGIAIIKDDFEHYKQFILLMIIDKENDTGKLLMYQHAETLKFQPCQYG